MNTPQPLRPAPRELKDERFVVRGYRDEDAEAVHAAVQESTEHLRPWLPWYDKHQSVEDTLAYVRQTQAEHVLRQDFELAVFLHSGRYLGGCALHPADWSVPSFMIGYWIRASEEGKGYVTGAVRLLTREAFDHLGAERVYLYCDAENRRSARVAERLGFVLEGRARRARRNTSGQLADVLYYSLLRQDFERPFKDGLTVAGASY